MITKLHLRNYRCFEDHTLEFRPTTIIIGKNNAGKSTIVEALRILSTIVNRYQWLNFQDVPNWIDIPSRERGVSPSLKNLDINLVSLFHRYSNPPAIITANFLRGEQLAVYIGNEGKVHAIIRDRYGKAVTTKGQAQAIKLPQVSILPQIGPLAIEEKILNPEYVRISASSHLASIHFRNQINIQYELFRRFKRLAESSWPKLRILSLDGRNAMPGKILSLFVQDGDFVAEIGWMGHGLQMWLQTMWFLTRSESDDTIILDEPDVYLHADLQRKLIRFLKGRSHQMIIATHSTEILSEVESDQVLVVDRRRNTSNFTNSIPAIQRVIDQIGSAHNLQLARLWNSRRLLIVEGKDIIILKYIHEKLFPGVEEPFDTIPNFSIGGWGGWNYVIGSKLLLKNAGGEEITTYCIFDSDYHTPDEIEKRTNEAKKYGVQLHVWKRKEIENYLIVPSAIYRIISSRSRNYSPDLNEISNKIELIADELRDEAFDAISNEYHHHKRLDASQSNKKAREIIDKAWGTLEGRLSLISGKKAISMLSQWAQDNHGISIGNIAITKELNPEEISFEIKEVIKSIENNISFKNL